MPLPVVYAQANIVISALEAFQYELVTWWIGPSTSTPGQAGADALAAAIDSDISAALLPVLTVDCGYDGVKVRVNDHGAIFTSINTTGHGAGSAGGDYQPPQVAVVLRKHSDAPGRPGLGRWYVPLIPENFTDGLNLTNPGLAQYANLLTELRAVKTAGAITWAAGHRSRRNDTLLPITSGSVSGRLKRQGRRLVQTLLD